MKMNIRQGARLRRGASLVEFALVLPVILLIFCAILEFSHVSLMRHSAEAAAYEGCRSAIVVGASASDAEEAVGELLSAASIREWQSSIEPRLIHEATAQVTVTVTIPVAENAWITPFFLKDKVVVRSVSLITERPSNVQLTGLPSQQQLLGVNALGLGL